MTDESTFQPTVSQPIVIRIKDASINADVVSFAVETKTNLPEYKFKDCITNRLHEQFQWLHRQFINNDLYSGLVIPPLPNKPDFSISRDSLSVYTEEENVESDEYRKMRLELEREYLAIFRKTVAFHETYLKKIAGNPVMRLDPNFMEFLQSPQTIGSKEGAGSVIMGLMKSIKKSFDANIVNSIIDVKDTDSFFDGERHFFIQFIYGYRDAVNIADQMTSSEKAICNSYIKLGSAFTNFAMNEYTKLSRILEPIGLGLEKIRKDEGLISSSEDLKLSDTLRFHLLNSEACKDLLFRRTRALIAVDSALNKLKKAKIKEINVAEADDEYQRRLKFFEDISESAKIELEMQHSSRIVDFRNNLTSYCELEISHHKAVQNTLQLLLDKLEAEECT